jgi:nicotinate dehydrogenase subunit B
MDELAETAGEDPVAYRLSLMSDPRGRRVIETAAEMGDWFGTTARDGRARGFGFARYKNRAAYAAVVAEVEVDEQVRLVRVWAAVDAGLVIKPDGAANQIEGGIIQAASWTLKEGVRFADGRVASDTWESYPTLHFPRSRRSTSASSRHGTSRRWVWAKPRWALPRRQSAMRWRARSADAFAPCH